MSAEEEKSIRRKRGRPRSLMREAESGTVRALDRGLALLHQLSLRGSMTLSVLAREAEIPASTAHRLLTTLYQHGFVRFDADTQEWAIGIGAYRVGATYLARSNLVDAARPILRRLMEQTGETANLAVLEGHEIVFVSQVETQHPVRAFFLPGTRSLLHASGIGKAMLACLGNEEIIAAIRKMGLPRYTPNTITSPETLLAELARIRKQGYSLDDEEQFSGMRCLGAAIFNSFGEAVAGISISGPAGRFDDGMIAQNRQHVMQAAEEITSATGGRIRQKPD